VAAGFILVFVYAATCPLGVAIGMGVAETYDPESVKAIATQASNCGSMREATSHMLSYYWLWLIVLVYCIVHGHRRWHV
jgi:hypothetical protein